MEAKLAQLIRMTSNYTVADWLGRGMASEEAEAEVLHPKDSLVICFEPSSWMTPLEKNGIQHVWTGAVMIPETMYEIIAE